MLDMELENMSISELKKFQKSVEKTISQYDARQKAEARQKVENFASELGYSIAELFGIEGKVKKRRSSPKPKFRNPEDASQTWSGRGRKPVWFTNAIEAGASKEDLLIA